MSGFNFNRALFVVGSLFNAALSIAFAFVMATNMANGPAAMRVLGVGWFILAFGALQAQLGVACAAED